MDNLPAFTHLVQAVGVGAAFYMSGYHYASDRLALPGALLARDPSTQVAQWHLGWDLGRKIGPALVNVVTASFAWLAWKEGTSHPSFPLHVAAAVCAGAVAPYTFAKVFPINDVLLAEHRKVRKAEETGKADGAVVDGGKVVRNVEAWRSGDRVRAALMHAAAAAGLVALVRGGA